MSAPSLRSTALLTELLGFPPISLVDDIINNVNEVMYKCTAAMEKYLLRKSIVDDVDYSEEIKVGVAKLETLLEHTVDKNFDKLELYVLRNVLRIPDELIDGDTFLLPHQVGLDTSCLNGIDREKLEFEMRIMELDQKLARHELLRREIERVRELKLKFVRFKKLVMESIKRALEEEQINGDNAANGTMKDVLRSLKPIDDTLRSLVSQLKEIYTENEQFGSISEFREKIQNVREKRLASDRLSRSKYLRRATQMTLNQLELNESGPSTKRHEEQREIGSGMQHLEIQDPDLSFFTDDHEASKVAPATES